MAGEEDVCEKDLAAKARNSEELREVCKDSLEIPEDSVKSSALLQGSWPPPSTADEDEYKRKRPIEEMIDVSLSQSEDPTEHAVISPKRPLDSPVPGAKRPKLSINGSKAGAGYPSESSASSSRTLHGLTAPIWERIFCYVPPVFLGRLLRVSRDFQSLLNPATPHASDRRLSPNEIWLASRRRFAPGLPAAMPGQTDLEMWRMIRGTSCQICQKISTLLTVTTSSDVWRADPSSDGLRVVWPLGARCCNPCLQRGVEQEKSLLFSSSFPSFVLPALSCIFVTQDSHYVPSIFVRDQAHPADVQIGKSYSKTRLAEIVEHSKTIKRGDPAAADEWLATLQLKSTAWSEAATAWELWEKKGGLRKVNLKKKNPSAVKQIPGTMRPPPLNPTPAWPGSETTSQSNNSPLASAGTANSMISPFTPNPLYSPYNEASTISPGTTRTSFQPAGSRPFRDLRDVNEAKAARKAEIERRCMLLDPPIAPDVLAQMDSFQAALQIPAQLNDQSWEMLKPRLLSQRESAEQRERERAEQEAALKAIAEERRLQETTSKEAKDALEQAWDLTQAPIRDRLSLYTDEIIRLQWDSGSAIQQTNCAKFAADVLTHVRRRFYEDQHSENFLSQHYSSAVSGNSRDDDKTLILENMKWVFDNKIKPLTEPLQKEIFLCNGCEDILKYYGFEAVIQHYAAKHTSSLSQGNVVVHWRAKWPDPPPFHQDPDAAKSKFYATVMPLADDVQVQAGINPQPLSGNTYPGADGSNPNGQYLNGSSDSQQSPFTSQTPYARPFVHPTPSYSLHTSPQIPSYSPYQPPQLTNSGQVGNYSANSGDATLALQMQPGLSTPTQTTGQAYQSAFVGTQIYQIQMTELAKHAREVWFAMNSIKEIPASLRIFVVIHHVAERFANTWKTDPGVSMFLDGLNHNPQMRPVRSLNGLACRTCKRTLNLYGPESSSNTGLEGSRLFTLPHLLTHFKNVHVEITIPGTPSALGAATSSLDWKKDMVELPDKSTIFSIVHASGMDDNKLSLMAQALPEVFPAPVPKLAVLRSNARGSSNGPSGNYQAYGAANTVKPGHRNVENQDRDEITSTALPSSFSVDISRGSFSSPHDYEPAGDDEYDPHRPAYLGIIVKSRHGAQATRQSSGNSSAVSPELQRFPREPRHAPEDRDREVVHELYEYSPAGSATAEHHQVPRSDADRFLNELQPAIQQSTAQIGGSRAPHDAYRPSSPRHANSEHPDDAARREEHREHGRNVTYARTGPSYGRPHVASDSHQDDSAGPGHDIPTKMYRPAIPTGTVPITETSHTAIFQRDYNHRSDGDRIYYTDQSLPNTETRVFRGADGREWYETVEVRGPPRSPIPRDYPAVRYVDSNGYEIPTRARAAYPSTSPVVYNDGVYEEYPRLPRHSVSEASANRGGHVEYIPVPEGHSDEPRYYYADSALQLASERPDTDLHEEEYPDQRAQPYPDETRHASGPPRWVGHPRDVQYQHIR